MRIIPIKRRMRFRSPWRGVALALPLLLLACAAPRRAPGPASPTGAASPTGVGGRAPLRVVATVLPVGLFTRAVAGSCATVDSLLPPGADLHDLQLSPSQLARLQNADVLVLNGLGLESSLTSLLAAATHPDLRRVEAARGGAGANPHVWLDPRRAAAQVRTIRDALAAADPARAACFRANAAAYLAELDRLDADLARQLAPYAGRRIVAYHDLAPAFAARYRLRSEALVDLPGHSPSVADLQRLEGLLRRSGVQALLAEPGGGQRALRALADDLDLRVLPFDPIETAAPADSLRPAHYLEAMRRNGASVAASFRPARRR